MTAQLGPTVDQWGMCCPWPRDLCPVHGADAMYDDRTAAGIAAGVERRDVCAECEAGAANGRAQLAPCPACDEGRGTVDDHGRCPFCGRQVTVV